MEAYETMSKITQIALKHLSPTTSEEKMLLQKAVAMEVIPTIKHYKWLIESGCEDCPLEDILPVYKSLLRILNAAPQELRKEVAEILYEVATPSLVYLVRFYPMTIKFSKKPVKITETCEHRIWLLAGDYKVLNKEKRVCPEFNYQDLTMAYPEETLTTVELKKGIVIYNGKQRIMWVVV